MITGNTTTFITYGNRARVMFTFDMQRKPLYYVVNLVIPCCLLSCIVAITFILPPTCYMRLTLSTYMYGHCIKNVTFYYRTMHALLS